MITQTRVVSRSPQERAGKMSLRVSADVLERAEQGSVSDGEFWSVVADSLPLAVSAVEAAITSHMASGQTNFVYNAKPKSEKERSQLLRLLASTSMREMAERKYGVKLGFINCHFIAVTRNGADTDEWKQLISPTHQLRMQSPNLVDC